MPPSDYILNLRRRVGHELLLMPGVAAVVRDAAGRVLLGRRADDGRWGLPAGAVDPGEAPARAVAREVWEEAGLRVRPERVLGVFGGADGFRHAYPNGDRAEYLVVLFACTPVGGSLRNRDGEVREFRYFAPHELPALPYPRHLFDGDGPREAFFQWDPAWLDRPV